MVTPRQVAVMLSIDGTRRHYLLETNQREITDFDAYTQYSAASHVAVYESLYRLGVKTILSAILYPPNFRRSERYLKMAVGACRALLLTGAFCDLYERLGIRARLYGDYDLAPNAAPVCEDLESLAETLRETTPEGERMILFGFTAGTFAEEAIARTLMHHAANQKMPTEEALRRACFPEGPEQIDILIMAGWLRVGSILPPLLDNGKTDIYVLNHLALDLSELQARRILYDHLFLRWAGPEDDAHYTDEDMAALKAYYQTSEKHIRGLGHVVGPGLWYAL